MGGYHVCLRYNLHLWSVFGDTVFGFRHLYSNISLLRVVWMDRFMSVKLQKVVDVVMGYIWYRSNALCIQ